MDVIGAVASYVIGVAFVVAGGSKLAAGPSWPSQAREFGAPSIAIPVVPWFELTVGALAIVGVARPWPEAVAAATLVVFTALIVLRLAQGRRPACACFGAWSATPIGPGHVIRNLVLLAVATLAVVGSSL